MSTLGSRKFQCLEDASLYNMERNIRTHHEGDRIHYRRTYLNTANGSQGGFLLKRKGTVYRITVYCCDFCTDSPPLDWLGW